MHNEQPQILRVGDGDQSRDIAVLAAPTEPATTGVIWLPGFMSDMNSTKATALADWSRARGFGCTRFDYSGHGQSSGRFVDGRIGLWLDEAAAVFIKVTAGPQVVVGSSMGGYIALLLLRRLMAADAEAARRILGLVLIAPAWDMTEELMWNKFPPAARRDIEERGVHYRPSEYGAPYPLSRGLIEEGRDHLLADHSYDPKRPVVVLQGLLDESVPAAHARRLSDLLPGGHVRMIDIADGEHRLARQSDLALLFDAIAGIAALSDPQVS